LRLETARKLFYDKYKYKLVAYSTIASIFRNVGLDFARRELDSLQYQVDQGARTLTMPRRLYWGRNIPYEDFEDGKYLLREFTRQKDFTLRVEMNFLNIYSNDKNWLKSLQKNVNHPVEFWSPAEYVEKLDKNQVVVEVPDMKYRVTLRSCNRDFANWCENNLDKIKIGNTVLSTIQYGGDISGRYFYVRDEKVLTLVELLIGTGIRRIDEVVCPSNIDK